MANSFLDRIPRQKFGQLNDTEVPTKVIHITDVYSYMYSQDKQIAEHVFKDVIRPAPIHRLFVDHMGIATSTLRNFSTVESGVPRTQVKISTAGAATFSVPTGGATVDLPLDVAAMQIGGQRVLPRKGNILIAPPSGIELEVTLVSPSGTTPFIRVKQVVAANPALTIKAGQEMPFMTGKIMADCEKPSGGTSKFIGAPTVYDYNIRTWTDDRTWCGNALHDKQPFYRKLFTINPESNSPTEVVSLWQQDAIDMINDFEMGMAHRRLFDSQFGLFPILKVKGTLFDHASTTEIVRADLNYITKNLTKRGFHCKRWMVPCGIDKMQKYQDFFEKTGVENRMTNAVYAETDSMKTLNLNWYRVLIDGFDISFYHEDCFSNGLGLGADNFNFPNAEIWIPLESNGFKALPEGVSWAEGFGSNKHITTVYSKSTSLGVPINGITESVGFLPGSTRNNNDPLDFTQKWAIRTDMTQIIHNPENFLISGLY